MTNHKPPERGVLGYHSEILPPLKRLLSDLPDGSCILDAGCGLGHISGKISAMGFRVTGIDTSDEGIRFCRRTHPEASFLVASADNPKLAETLGRTFDAIVATEVIEHLYSPETFLRNCTALLRPGGLLILSTPYHGYLKNLLLALLNRFDRHFQPFREGGHIKFWSRKTLTGFLTLHGFQVTDYAGCGRWPWVWKAMAVRAVRTP